MTAEPETADAGTTAPAAEDAGTRSGLGDAATGGAGVPGRRRTLGTLVRVGFVLMVLAAAVWAVASRWSEVVDGFSRVSAGPVIGAFVLCAFGLWAGAPAWRDLLEGLGSRLSLRNAQRVFLLGQLGKYLPGGLWTILAQASLARDLRVPRTRSASAGLLSLVVSLVTSSVLAAVTLVISGREVLGHYVWVLLVALPLLVFLHPSLLAWAARLAGKVLRRPLALNRIPERLLLRAAMWQFLGQIALGLQLWLIIGTVGGHYPSPLLAVGLFNLAWVAGLVVVFAPAGAGVREAVLVLGLAPFMDSGQALVVALLSRVLTIIADFLLAGGGALMVKGKPAAAASSPGRREDAT